MNYATDETFFMMVFVLPGLFGITLLGEGIKKIMNGEGSGVIGLVAGSVFMGLVVFAYFYVQNMVF